MLPSRAPSRPSRPTARALAAGLAGALAAALLAPATSGATTAAQAADRPSPGASAAPAASTASTARTARTASTASTARTAPRRIAYAQQESQRQLRRGAHLGTRARRGRLVIASPRGRRTHAGRTYQYATHLSPWRRPGFGLTELIASWNATTPPGTWIQVRARFRSGGRRSSWDTLAHWAGQDGRVKRRSPGSQGDDMGRVTVDIWRSASSRGVRQWQLRVDLMRPLGSTRTPRVQMIGAVASRLPGSAPRTSRPGPGRGRALRVPRWSQYTHTNHYPRWGGGGQAWCSPTAVSMVLGRYGRLPGRRAYRWVPRGHPQPWVDHAARGTYDHAYRGTGNWSFNAAYAGQRGTKAFVTRLRSLREAERFVATGIPVVISVAWGSGQLSNASVGASNGHLMVVSGFTRAGDAIVHDPAGRGRGVRRVYDRAQLERLWLRASGGVAYVIRPRGRSLPARHGNRNW